MPSSSKKQKKQPEQPASEDEAIENFTMFEELESETAWKLLREFRIRSAALAATEDELAEHVLHRLEPYKCIHERQNQHTKFRAAIRSLFLDPSDAEMLDLYKFQEYEDRK